VAASAASLTSNAAMPIEAVATAAERLDSQHHCPDLINLSECRVVEISGSFLSSRAWRHQNAALTAATSVVVPCYARIEIHHGRPITATFFAGYDTHWRIPSMFWLWSPCFRRCCNVLVSCCVWRRM